MAKGDIFVRIGVDVSALEKALNKATEHIEKFGKQMKKIGRDLTEAITVPIMGLGYAALRASVDATYQFEKFSARTKIAMGKLGDDIAKAINLEDLLDRASAGVEKLTGWFNKQDAETKKLIISTAAFAAALGPALMIMGRLVEAFGAISGKVVFVSLLLYKVVASIGILTASLIGWPATIIAGTAALVGFAVGWDNVAKAASKASSVIGAFGGGKGFTGGLREQVGGQAGAMTYQPKPGDLDPFAEYVAPKTGTGFSDMMEKMNQYTIRGMGYLREWGAVAAASGQQLLTGLVAPMEKSVTVMDAIQQAMAQIPPMAVQFANALMGMFQQLAQGIGNTLAQVIVYGGSLAAAMKALLKQILASIISTLIQLGIQWVITSVLKKLTQGTEAAATLSAQASIVYASVFASYAGIPFVGPALGAAAGAAAVSAMLAGAATSGAIGLGVGAATTAGAATGGLFTKPGLTGIAERGKPEIVLNQDNVRRFFGGALGGGSQTIIVNLDSEPIISTVVRGMPAYLRLQGAI